MLRTSIGEEVPDSYGPMIGAWLGLDPARCAAAAEAGLRQASAIAQAVREAWD
ncbi:hypothetical protein [Achromobacter anxifer]|uniref:hypothetical protein n=1 Tax=Achromobacter anxifer TaxID=1287737 RepID=UPI002157DBD2|nr:hypothetical protein [Achromobacter anxifer]